MKKNEKVPLQALRMRGGWQMIRNHFLDVDVTQYENDDKIWENFTQDIMYIRKLPNKKGESVGLHLGWYPENDPRGQFCLKIIKDDDIVNPVRVFSSRDKNEIVDTIEKYLLELLRSKYSWVRRTYNEMYNRRE